jgi:hypothetical protein
MALEHTATSLNAYLNAGTSKQHQNTLKTLMWTKIISLLCVHVVSDAPTMLLLQALVNLATIWLCSDGVHVHLQIKGDLYVNRHRYKHCRLILGV